MIKINFDYLDEGIMVNKEKPTILVIESSAIFSKVMFSLYNHEDYFKIYDDTYKLLSEKNIILILNPLLFDFHERNIKNMIYNHVSSQLQEDIAFSEKVLCDYQDLAKKIVEHIETVGEVEFDYNDEIDLKDVLKLIGLSLNLDTIMNTFDKVQLIINVLNEMDNDKLLVFMNLNSMLSENEYKVVLEEIEMKSLRVLIIENNNSLKDIPHYLLDSDFNLSKL